MPGGTFDFSSIVQLSALLQMLTMDVETIAYRQFTGEDRLLFPGLRASLAERIQQARLSHFFCMGAKRTPDDFATLPKPGVVLAGLMAYEALCPGRLSR